MSGHGAPGTSRGGYRARVRYQLVRRNVYPHRRVKVMTEDDIMVCQCTASDGCGKECINRQLQIECTKGYASGRGL